MTRPPTPPPVQRITPKDAILMLVHGLIPETDAAALRPANVSVETLVRMMRDANEIRNRTVSIPNVDRYARDMTNHKWLFTGDPIRIDKNGFVRDGQHRLLAIVRSGIPQYMTVMHNIDPDLQMVLDIGRARSPRDQLRIRGIANYANAASGASLWLRWKAGRILDSSFQPSVVEVTDVAAHDPSIQEACQTMMRVRQYLKYAPAAALVAAYIEASKIDVDFRDEFFKKLGTGTGITEGDPVGVLRNMLGRYSPQSPPVRFGQRGLFWMIVHTWNKSRKNETLKTIRIPWQLTSKTFPEMV